MKKYIFILTLILSCVNAWSETKTPSSYEDRIRKAFHMQNWESGKVILDSALVDYPMVSNFYELKGQYMLHLIDHPGVVRDKEFENRSKQQMYDDTRFTLIHCIELDEKNLNARRMLMRIEIDTQHYSSAIVYCNELLEENPYNERLWRTKIDLYRKMNNNVEADRLLERLMNIYHDNPTLKKDIADRKQIQLKEQREKGDHAGMEKTLRELIDMEPSEGEHYIALVNLLYNFGRYADAADMAERGVLASKSPSDRLTLISKRVGILTDMNRYNEALGYLNSMQKKFHSPYLASIINDLSMETARAARMNDPFEAYAKVYEKNKNREALNYLIATSIQRNYLDDALYYLKEGRRQADSPKLRYLEYLVQKRLGNAKKAENLLKELVVITPNDTAIAIELAEIYLKQSSDLIAQQLYSEAIPILEEASTLNADIETIDAIQRRLLNCYLQNRQFQKAEAMLETLNNYNKAPYYLEMRATILNARGRTHEALEFIFNEYKNIPPEMTERRERLSNAYEEIVVPYIKKIMAAGMINDARKQLGEALQICPKSDDLLRYAISVSLANRDQNTAMSYVESGITLYPDEPYYRLKQAQILIMQDKYYESYDSLYKLVTTYPGDTVIVKAFSECTVEMAQDYIKKKWYDEALGILDKALYFDPYNHDLFYTKYYIYRKKKDWHNAELCLRNYKPAYNELSEYRHYLEEAYNQQLLNTLMFEYQQARPGQVDAITGNAYGSYTRKIQYHRNGKPREDALTFGLGYAGRDGTAEQSIKNNDIIKGGTGFQLSGTWQHQFCDRLTASAQLAWSNRYFPVWTINFGATYELNNNWQLNGRISYRRLKAYKGIYQMEKEFSGYNDVGQEQYNTVLKRTGWRVRNKQLLQFGLGASKTLDDEGRFDLSFGADLFLMADNTYSGGLRAFTYTTYLYGNGNVRFTFRPLHEKRTYFYVAGGLGNAPEGSLIDQSMGVAFSDLNTFVGMGGYYFVNRWLGFSLHGTWYTMMSQDETLSHPLNGTTAQTEKNYTNHFYIHLATQINF